MIFSNTSQMLFNLLGNIFLDEEISHKYYRKLTTNMRVYQFIHNEYFSKTKLLQLQNQQKYFHIFADYKK